MSLIPKNGIDEQCLERAMQLVKDKPVAGGATVFDADVILLANTANFGEGDDGNHTAVTVESMTSWLIMVQVGSTWTGTSPTLAVTIEVSDDGGSTYREALLFPQIAEVDAETNGQVTYYAVVICPMPAAGYSTILMRAYTDAAGTTPDCGTVGIRAMALDLSGNFPTGIVGRDIRADSYQRFA